MNINLDTLKKFNLFKNCSFEDIREILHNCRGLISKYRNHDIIYHAGEPISKTALVLSGQVAVLHYSRNGDAKMISMFGTGSAVGCAFNLSGQPNQSLTIQSSGDSDILFLDLCDMVNRSFGKSYGKNLIRNIIKLTADATIYQNNRAKLLSEKKLRDKILLLLNDFKENEHSTSVVLPFNREELAMYLGTDRSSVCRELRHMYTDGLIRFNGNHIEICA